MSGASFKLLLRWELRHALRGKLLWIALGIIAAAFWWGAHNASTLHRSQADAQMRTAQREQTWVEDLRVRAEQYRVSAQMPLPYWQDPTDVAGFAQYFLLKHSLKPHLPLSVLAVGSSDLLPDWQQVRLSTAFASDGSYDFLSPRLLAIGQFDLAFAIAYLLPLALILLTVLMCTFERDRGVLRLIAAQSVGPRRWLTARVTALALIVIPAVCLLLILVLASNQAKLLLAVPELSTALALTVAYALFWIAVASVVLARWPRAATAIGVLVSVWLWLSVAVPLLSSVIFDALVPGISAAEIVDERRHIEDELDARENEIVTAGMRADARLAPAIDRAPTLDYATRLTFIVPELERRLEPRQRALDEFHTRNAAFSRWISLIAVPVGIESALATLAGTDQGRHGQFETQSREYQLALRAFFYSRIHEQIIAPTPRPLPDTRGRFNFTDYERIPQFEMRDAPAAQRVLASLPTLSLLLVLALLFAAWARVSLRDWPQDL